MFNDEGREQELVHVEERGVLCLLFVFRWQINSVRCTDSVFALCAVQNKHNIVMMQQVRLISVHDRDPASRQVCARIRQLSFASPSHLSICGRCLSYMMSTEE